MTADGRRILLVEDDEDTRQLLAPALKAQGYHVEQAGTADEGLTDLDNVVFTPTLVKRRPMPKAWILGDLSNPVVVTDLLHMCGIDPLP